MGLFHKKHTPSVTLDREHQSPAVRKSICTGEMTGGYLDRADGKFHELSLISGPDGLETFCRELGVRPDEVETIY